MYTSPEDKAREALEKRNAARARSETTLKIPRPKTRSTVETPEAELGRSPGDQTTNSGLVCSWPIPWHNQYAPLCLQGASFLALHKERLPNGADFVDIVAPEEERRQIVSGTILPHNFGLNDVMRGLDEHDDDDEEQGGEEEAEE